MAAVLTNKNELYNLADFEVSTVADMSKLPTTTTGGSGDLSYVGPVGMGSTCLVLATSAVYKLDGEDNTWKEI